METKSQIKEMFQKKFNISAEDTRVFYSGGRVNLIGEHTDYNEGYVFPAALSLGSYTCIKKRDDRIIRLAATDLDVVVEADLDHLLDYKDIKWGKYQLGVIWEFTKLSDNLCGADILFHDTIPHSGGLSSSAAIQLCCAKAYADLNELKIDNTELAKIARLSENEYIGVQCGVMDQFASAMGKKECAILLNCKTLAFDYIPLHLGDYRIVIANTNKKRSLADSKYNERCAECAKGLTNLQKVLPGKESLCDISPEELSGAISAISDETIKKRVTHVIVENYRVLDSAKVLQSGDLEAFGKLMNDSHASLKDLYEVTGIELDTLAESAQTLPGVLGSRMTGAGFGGCTVSIVKTDCVDAFCTELNKIYMDKIGYAPSFYLPDIENGSHEIL
jgi:galactokinase